MRLCGDGEFPTPPGKGSKEGTRPAPQNVFLLSDLKMEHFCAVFNGRNKDVIARGGDN